MWPTVRAYANPLSILKMLLDTYIIGINSATKDANTVRSLSLEISIQNLDVNAVVTYSVYDVEWRTRERESNQLLTILISPVLSVALNSKNIIIYIRPLIINETSYTSLVNMLQDSIYVQDAMLEQNLR
jgi:hypothetical protein